MAEENKLVGGLNDKKHVEAVTARSNSDKELMEKVKKLNMVLENLMLDVPGGIDRMVTWQIERGKIVNATVEEKPAPSDWRKTKIDKKKVDFRATAKYDVSVGIHKGEQTSMMALMKGQYKMQGSMVKIMKMTPEMNAWNEVASTVPCEY
ncbi:MAG: hypothetical protein ABIJ37_07675 [Pseudomonadota bacterium]